MVMGEPVGVVGPLVVEQTEEFAILQACPPALRPWLRVMGVAEGGRDGAADRRTRLVTDVHELAHGTLDQPLLPPGVEDLTLPAHDHGQDAGVARQPTDFVGLMTSPVEVSTTPAVR